MKIADKEESLHEYMLSRLRIAVETADIEEIRLIQKSFRLDMSSIRFDDHSTPLHIAVRQGDFATTLFLLNSGARIDVVDEVLSFLLFRITS